MKTKLITRIKKSLYEHSAYVKNCYTAICTAVPWESGPVFLNNSAPHTILRIQKLLLLCSSCALYEEGQTLRRTYRLYTTSVFASFAHLKYIITALTRYTIHMSNVAMLSFPRENATTHMITVTTSTTIQMIHCSMNIFTEIIIATTEGQHFSPQLP